MPIERALHAAPNPLLVAVTCGFLVQLWKFVASSLAGRRLNFRRLVETGGMPSSHSAGVASLSTAVGLCEGFGSVLFAVTVYFSLIVMYDAAGLRRAAGRQATLLNRLIDTHYAHDKRLVEHRLLELLGHTPLEVLAGAVIGAAFTVLWYRIGGFFG